ncbi:hypothetical protein AAF712_011356 [Marasmius tenuissimus]|uniref:Uncharacterized protein n=1 Tax=Marasmius tenuissimus TaxID=585030 RepID=A0ABR2ZKA0_9AGAR|nr:hypothetical protein PM082_015022 [Marasmius tenuissimus]
MEDMRITSGEFEALHKWYSLEKKTKGKSKVSSETKAATVSTDVDSKDPQKPSFEGGTEDVMHEDEESQGTFRALEDTKTKRTAIGGNRVEIPLREDSRPRDTGNSVDTLLHDDVLVDDDDELQYPISAEESLSGNNSCSEMLTQNQASRIQSTELPPESSTLLAAQLLQLKSDVQETTASLRFRRATKDKSVDVYDQIAVKLGDLMIQFGVKD